MLQAVSEGGAVQQQDGWAAIRPGGASDSALRLANVRQAALGALQHGGAILPAQPQLLATGGIGDAGNGIAGGQVSQLRTQIPALRIPHLCVPALRTEPECLSGHRGWDTGRRCQVAAQLPEQCTQFRRSATEAAVPFRNGDGRPAQLHGLGPELGAQFARAFRAALNPVQAAFRLQHSADGAAQRLQVH